MRFVREITARIISLARTFPAVVVTGARQVGKTTLLRQAFPDHSYVSLDSVPDAEMAERGPEAFLRRYPPPVVIDEVQYAPGLFRHLKTHIDRDREANGRFILTGSQKFVLMKEVSESLAGRCGVVELETLSAPELGDELTKFIAGHGAGAVLGRGLYPALWANPEISAGEFYRAYLATYIERDVRQLINITSVRDFDRFLRICAAQNGQVLNKASIARDVGISQKTVSDWLSVLVASNQISILEPYFANIRKRLVKSPRLYFADTGLLAFLLGVPPRGLEEFFGIGALWECYLYAELRKFRETHAIEGSLWFYRDNQGNEVDFLLSYGGKIHLLEAKWTELPGSRHGAGLAAVSEVLPDPVGLQWIVSRATARYPLGEGREVVNGFRLGSELREALGE